MISELSIAFLCGYMIIIFRPIIGKCLFYKKKNQENRIGITNADNSLVRKNCIHKITLKTLLFQPAIADN